MYNAHLLSGLYRITTPLHGEWTMRIERTRDETNEDKLVNVSLSKGQGETRIGRRCSDSQYACKFVVDTIVNDGNIAAYDYLEAEVAPLICSAFTD